MENVLNQQSEILEKGIQQENVDTYVNGVEGIENFEDGNKVTDTLIGLAIGVGVSLIAVKAGKFIVNKFKKKHNEHNVEYQDIKYEDVENENEDEK